MPKREDHHLYASTKTTAQLALDLAATASHAFTMIVLLNLERRDKMWEIVFYLLAITLGLQSILAIGLFILRLMKNGGGPIPRTALVLNDVFFWGCLFVAVLEVTIAALEKFGLGHGPQDIHKTNVNISDLNLQEICQGFRGQEPH
jgi:hypothetical protein